MERTLCLLLGWVLAIVNSGFAQENFRIISGIPHLPVFANTTSVGSPQTGMIIFCTAHDMPMIYCGQDWCNLCTNEVDATNYEFFYTENGIPFLPAKADVGTSPTPMQGSIYYSTTSNSVMIYGNNGWEAVRELDGSTYNEGDNFYTDANLKIIKLPVLSSDPSTDITTGAFYFNSTTKKIRFYNNSGVWTSVSCDCVDFTISHTEGVNGAPETLTNITYKVVQTDHGGKCQCWLAQNLGAVSQPTSSTDAAYASRGWFWQFNRSQGYSYNASRYPSTPWEGPIDENSNWLISNDPCRLLLGGAWRIPTAVEWTTMDTNSGWVIANDMYDSQMKLHLCGHINYLNGILGGVGVYGARWSSVQYTTTLGYFLETGVSWVALGSANGRKSLGMFISNKTY